MAEGKEAWGKGGSAPQASYPPPGNPAASYPPPGYPQAGYPQAGNAPPVYPPAGNPQQGYPPAAHPQASFPPAGSAPAGHPPAGYPPRGDGQPVPGVPAPAGGPVTVQGESNFVFDKNAPLYYPPDATEPVFLGATKGHDSINLHCGKCGYQGPSKVARKVGLANKLAALPTLGLSLLVPADTHHHCPNCGTHVAFAKLL
ncbi:unnamed protein product [Ostreobium quekettii]|uniref:LITAF domain-containing protein n=1 Tax=Ostreobium quekettii TaxID=121088 RepID=A0A8S1J1J5_9CHLO|nr:unnamed protein product [Ostreobium quekettii]|eukprot:evm.model.scf_359.4 EVM.evm.TU.scf_359.4   scf_359:20506-21471(+)